MRNQYVQNVLTRKPWLKPDDVVDKAVDDAVEDITETAKEGMYDQDEFDNAIAESSYECREEMREDVLHIIKNDDLSDSQKLKLIEELF